MRAPYLRHAPGLSLRPARRPDRLVRMLVPLLLGAAAVLSVFAQVPPDLRDADLDRSGDVSLAELIAFVEADARTAPPAVDANVILRFRGLALARASYTRSISGRSPEWVPAPVDTSGVALLPGLSAGTYRIRALSESGALISEWGSIPINAGIVQTVVLKQGERAEVRAHGSPHRSAAPHRAFDRVFMKGNQWLRNRTADQLDGFDVIRLSTYVAPHYMKAVTDTLGKSLMLGLSGPVAPDDHTYPGDVLAAWPDSGAIRHFANFLDTLRAVHDVRVDAVMYNLEVPYRVNAHRGSLSQVTASFTRMIRTYVEVYRARCPNGQFWVYSGAHRPFGTENIQYGVDWSGLTEEPGGIDVCYTGIPVDVATVSPETFSAHVEEALRATASVANGKQVVYQAMSHGGEPVVSAYHHRWEAYKDILRRTRDVLGEINGGPRTITWYNTHYHGTFEQAGDTFRVDYTLDGYGEDPTGDIPWRHPSAYPARLWHGDAPWPWADETRIANRWEAEFVANFLAGTGYVPGTAEVGPNDVWEGNVTLLGDVVVPGGALLRLRPGTTVAFRTRTDLYASGKDTTRAEIVVLPGGELIADGSGGDFITFRSADRDAPGQDDWAGIRNAGGRLTLRRAVIRDARTAIDALPGDTVEGCRFENNRSDVP